MGKVFFVDKDGNELYKQSLQSHIALAKYFLDNSNSLRRQYVNRENTQEGIVEFLQNSKGFMKGSQHGSYRIITFDSRLISDAQRETLRGYNEENYILDDRYITELRKMRERNKSGEER
jgi:hypothetical protein